MMFVSQIWRARLVAALALVWAAAVLLSGCNYADGASTAPSKRFNANNITGVDYAHGFRLEDFDGRTRTLTDFRGKVTVVFFGYTQCPDACPTALAELAGVVKELGPQADKLQVVFITVDPARDTAPLLKSYVTNFDPRFLALRGSDAQIAAVARDFKVYFAKVPGNTPETYAMDHTAGSYVFDPEGHIRLFAKMDMDPVKLASDIKILMTTASLNA